MNNEIVNLDFNNASSVANWLKINYLSLYGVSVEDKKKAFDLYGIFEIPFALDPIDKLCLLHTQLVKESKGEVFSDGITMLVNNIIKTHTDEVKTYSLKESRNIKNSVKRKKLEGIDGEIIKSFPDKALSSIINTVSAIKFNTINPLESICTMVGEIYGKQYPYLFYDTLCALWKYKNKFHDEVYELIKRFSTLPHFPNHRVFDTYAMLFEMKPVEWHSIFIEVFYDKFKLLCESSNNSSSISIPKELLETRWQNLYDLHNSELEKSNIEEKNISNGKFIYQLRKCAIFLSCSSCPSDITHSHKMVQVVTKASNDSDFLFDAHWPTCQFAEG